MRIRTRIAIAIAAIVVVADPARAQRLQGEVRDSLSRRPIPGAVLIQLDASGRTLARDLSDQRGLYSVAVREGATQLRVQRIGFQLRTVPIRSGIARIDVAMVLIPQFLAPTRVAATSCSARSDDGIAAALLDQARAGLLAAVVSREKSAAALTLLTYERDLTHEGAIVLQTVRVDSTVGATKSYVAARTGALFAELGFDEETGDRRFLHGPDADVFLDDAFIAAYCFRLTRGERSRPTQIGLGFGPARRKNRRIDIEGTIWVDTVAREVRDVEFRYVGMHPSYERFEPGGRIGFATMSSGLVLIDRWSLRLVGATFDTIRAPGQPATTDPTITPVYHLSEAGGELASARWPDGTSWKASLGELELRALDANGRPATGAKLRLAGTSYHATVPADGRVRLAPLLPGPYALIVEDPRLASIGLTLETPVAFTAARDSVHRATFEVPTAESFLDRKDRCGNKRTTIGEARPGIGDTLPWIIGRVGNADGAPAEKGRITVSREVRAGLWERTGEHYDVGGSGLFWFCSRVLRRNMDVRIEYRRDNKPPVVVPRRLDTYFTVVQVLPDSL